MIFQSIQGFLGEDKQTGRSCSCGSKYLDLLSSHLPVQEMQEIPGSGRSPGEGNGNPLQYSCLDNLMDRGAWWVTVHGVVKSCTWLKRLSTHTFSFICFTIGQVPKYWCLLTPYVTWTEIESICFNSAFQPCFTGLWSALGRHLQDGTIVWNLNLQSGRATARALSFKQAPANLQGRISQSEGTPRLSYEPMSVRSRASTFDGYPCEARHFLPLLTRPLNCPKEISHLQLLICLYPKRPGIFLNI